MILNPAEYRHILRHDLVAFIERCFRELNPRAAFIYGDYIEAMASKLEACRTGQIRRLIINLPPRSLKSLSASVAFVAWLLGHNPSLHVICASYGQDLSDKLARDRRNIMSTAWYKALFQTRLGDRQAVHDFETTASGSCLSTSVGGVLTGRGADFILIDDPMKPDDAYSESGRKAVQEWYDHTLFSRLNDKQNGCIVIIQQRLHQDDLVAHVLDQEAWEIVSFPAIAERDETHLIENVFGKRFFRRTAGEALHPEREPLSILKQLRATHGEYVFDAQFQQRPIPPGGGIIKKAWLQNYDPAALDGKELHVHQSWDTANKANEVNNYSVCVTFALRNRVCYILHVFRMRLDYPDLRRMANELAREYKAERVIIEDKASGTQLIQDLKADHVWRVEGYKPPAGMDKVMRLYAQSSMFESGKVLLPPSAPWLPEYITELTGFPSTKYDDQVDATTQALDFIRNHDPLASWRGLLDEDDGANGR